jgi:hypothetical protein
MFDCLLIEDSQPEISWNCLELAVCFKAEFSQKYSAKQAIHDQTIRATSRRYKMATGDIIICIYLILLHVKFSY